MSCNENELFLRIPKPLKSTEYLQYGQKSLIFVKIWGKYVTVRSKLCI